MRIHMTLLAATAALIVTASVPALADTSEGVARSSGTLRAGPGTEYPAVDHISRGDDLEIYGCTRGYEWCDVSVDDNRGWFPGSRIGYVEDGRQVIIQDAGPQIGIGILGFGARDYFQQHYRDRPFYNQYQRFDRGQRNGGGQINRGPGFRPDGTAQPNPDVRPNNNAPGRPSNPDFQTRNPPGNAPHREPSNAQRPPQPGRQPNQDFQTHNPTPNTPRQQPNTVQRPPQQVRPPEAHNPPPVQRAPAPAAQPTNPNFSGGGCAPGLACK